MSNMNSNRYNDDVLDLHVLLRDVLKIFKRAWWICVSAFVAVSVIFCAYQKYTYVDRKSTRLNSSHSRKSRMPSSA